MSVFDHRRAAAGLVAPLQRAGATVMGHFERGAMAHTKGDGSPVTEADRESEAILLDALSTIAPAIPVIAEERVAAEGAPNISERTFFLVDPLDGTKEFVAGTRDFTLNVALVRDRMPVFGMVYAPALAALYVTLGEDAAARTRLEPGGDAYLNDLDLRPLRTRALPPRLTALVSRSHMTGPTERFLARLPVGETSSAGSSLKFCRLAEGAGDVYPRLGRTMEWDTAAGDAVLRAAGGTVLGADGTALTYGKAEGGFANPPFVAWGRAPDPRFATFESD